MIRTKLRRMIDRCSKSIQTSIGSMLAAGLFVVVFSQVLAHAHDLSDGDSPRHRSTAIAIIGIFVFCAASAFGNIHSVIIGLDANPASNQTFDYQSRRDRMQLAVDSGVNYLYMHPTWAAIEPAAGSYDFSEVDFNAQFAEDHDLPVALTLRVIDTNIRALPGAYFGLSFDDPRLAQALRNALVAMAPRLRGRVRWISLGNEVDKYLLTYPNELLPYQRLMQNVLPTVRGTFPDAEFSINFTSQAVALMNNVLAPLTSLVDFCSYSYYPYTGDYVFSDPGLAASQISQMIYMAGGKPVLFQEIGYPSSPLLNSSPDRQAAFLQNTFDALRFYSGQVIGANFVWMSDLPPSAVNLLTQYYGFSGNTFREFVSTLGYRDQNDAPKPAWAVFRQNAPTLHWILDQPGTSLVSSGTVPTLNVGYARLNSSGASRPVSGMAILDYRQGGILTNEASVPDSPPAWSGRIYAEMGNGIGTRIAMANPGDQPSQVTFYFTDKNGVNSPSNTFVMPAFTQLSAFLDQYPFNLPSQIQGTLTFYASSAPVCATTIRGHMNERSEFLFSTGPVSDMSSAPGPVEIPYFADGGGWQTQVMLINPTATEIQGTVQFFDPGTSSRAGGPQFMATTAETAATFSYRIAANSSWTLMTMNTGASMTVGSVHIVPAPGQAAPVGSAVVSFRTGGVTVSETAVPVQRPAQSSFVFVEASDRKAMQTWIVIGNASNSSTAVTLELMTLGGTTTGKKTTVNVPGNGQIAALLDQIPGLALTPPFQGVLRITAQSASLSTIGLRGQYNERGDFLMATMFPVNESATVSTSLFFPNIADGAGFTTQIVTFSQTALPSFSGSLQFFSQRGTSLNVWLGSQ